MKDNIRNNKCYFIILDYTADLCHKEQLGVVLRIVNIFSGPVTAEEYVYKLYDPGHTTTGKGLTELLLKISSEIRIPLADCRGQPCDNGSNVKEKKQQCNISSYPSRKQKSSLNCLLCA